MKRMTMRQVEGWLFPIRNCLNEMKSGEIDAIDGLPVTRLSDDESFARVDHCIAGFVGAISRILPSYDVSPLKTLQEKLASDTPLFVSDVDSALGCLKNVGKPLIRVPWDAIKDALTTEMVAIELDRIGVVN